MHISCGTFIIVFTQFLDRSFFELYNKHKIKNAPKHGDTRDRETLDWVEVDGEELPPAGTF